jgi:hypothetical protein
MAVLSRFRLRQDALLLLVAVLMLLGGVKALAQGTVSRIVVTRSVGESAPTVELYLYGFQGDGSAADLTSQGFQVLHDGQAAEDVSVARTEPIGTMTIFVMDLPQSVAGQIPDVRDIILQYVSEATMQEQVDYVAIMKIGELTPETILNPESFHNGVRNAFATLPTAQAGRTALIDNLMIILDNMDVMKPSDELVSHIVLFSDGTDTVSSQFQDSDVPRRAAELGIPVHTIWIDNPAVTANKEGGRQYMQQISSGSGGLHMNMNSVEEQAALWQRIAAFRDQTVVRYTVTGQAGGDYTVEISLVGSPAVRDQTTVTIPAGAPSVVLNIPPEARQLTVTDINRAVSLSLSADVSWLDDVRRSVTSARLLLNGSDAGEVNPQDLDRFNFDLVGLREGTNRVQVAVVDDQGNRAVSPVVELTVNVGAETSIPTEVQPMGMVDRLRQQLSRYRGWLTGCFGVVGVVILLGLVAAVASRSPLLRQTGLTSGLYRLPFVRPFMSRSYTVQRNIARVQRTAGRYKRYTPEVKSAAEAKSKGRPSTAVGFLEVVSSVTSVSQRLELPEVEMKIGRSPKQANIVFHNDPTVSRIHATIVREGSVFRIFDEQSTSGSFVNEQRVPQPGLQLVDGDEIRLGAVRLRFRLL